MRQFILDKTPDRSGLVVVSGKDFRYLRQVLRVKNGDMINLRLADGTLQNSTVASIDDKAKKIIIQICAGTKRSGAKNSVGSAGTGVTTGTGVVEGEAFGNGSNSSETTRGPAGGTITRGVQADEIDAEVDFGGIEYNLFQFIPKPQKFELIVRQATECGVKNIIPVIGEYSEKSSILALQGNKKERLERIIKEARQQSGSPVDTKVLEPMTLEQAVEFWLKNESDDADADIGQASAVDSAAFAGFVLSERQDGDRSIRTILAEKQACGKIKKIGIACGSEGGISPSEVDFLVKKGLFNPIHFSVNILRCETAALYGIAAVQTGV